MQLNQTPAPRLPAGRTVEPGRAATVSVPATSANLGPGFDTLGLALAFHDRVRVEAVADGSVEVRITGVGADTLPLDESHLVVRTIRRTLAAAGYADTGLRLEAENAIPHGRGLGSSASAIVSGVLAGNALLPEADRLDADAVLNLCSAIEGHPDNVAPALRGGLAISWEQDGVFRSAHVPVHPEVHPVAAIPAVELSTEQARGLLPAAVPHAEAAANSGRAALLVHALATAPGLLFEATEEFLHQGYRAPAMPASAELIRRLRARGLPAVVSGAGPTVMVLAGSAADAGLAEALIQEAAADIGGNWTVRRLPVAADGAKVDMHQR